jgi:PAS domain S-box-containing protein
MKKNSLKNQENLKEIPDRLNDIFFIIDSNLNFSYLNKKSEVLINGSHKKAVGKALYEILPNLRGSDIDKLILNTLKTGQSQSIITEYKIEGEKSLFYVTIHPFSDGVSVLVRDVNEIIKQENLQKLGLLILERLNKSGEFRELIRDILLLIKTYTRFDAVGIRIRDGTDYPYYVTEGFSSGFIKTENELCTMDESGSLILDKNGNPFLECMCGNIIMGKTDSKFPYFTKEGSFWTNSTTKLLADTNERERLALTRKRCNIDGYESVALIPLRSDDEIVGLLQLNDKRENLLSSDIIKILQGFAASIATAISRDKTIRALEISEQRYNLAQQAANIGSWDWDIKTGELTWSEKIEPMFGFKKGEFGGTYEAFLNSVHPKDRDFVVKSVNDCMDHKKRYAIEHRIVWPNGTVRWVLERGDVIRDKNDEPRRMLGVVQDITNNKKMESELKQQKNHLEKMVADRTQELLNANINLRDEINERKKAEAYIERTKENLRNVIDSASELIISFDMNNRVSIWNKTAEVITGYKQIEVLNRSITKLNVFENKDVIINQIIRICEQKKSKLEDIILKTKENEKRIIRVEGTDIKSITQDCVGTLFIGKDITKDVELHNKLLEGNGYLVIDKNNKKSIDLIIDLTINDYKGLILTRGSPSLIKRLIPDKKNVEILLLSKEKQKNYNNISDLLSIEKTINNFISINKKTVILLDGIHYLITRFSFDKLIDTIYNLNDVIAKNNSIFFIRIDPSTIDSNQMAILENEMQMMPSQKIEDIIIEDYLYDIVKYISDQNQNNVIVSFKKVMAQFKIAYVTAASRLDTLEKKGLIFTKKQGKLRAIYITEKGKSLLNVRKTI